MLGELILGKYKVTRALDEGGMSKIYLARQQDQPRDAVVKVLKDSLRSQSTTREHFRREIHIMSRFRHPHAVAYYDSGMHDRYGPVLVMEYLRGVDLLCLLHREGRLTAERTGRLLAQLCDVLQAAHDAGIVHRDIKPGNVMILYPGTPQETVKLMDFGLAKMTSMLYISPEDLVDFNLAPASGTPEYIAPEMVRGNDLDARGDLYSLGVMLYEMLIGQRPFASGDVERLMLAHVNERPPHFAEIGLPDLVPPAIETLVLTCLAKHPDGRPNSAWELAQTYEKTLGRRISNGRVPILTKAAIANATSNPSRNPPLPDAKGTAGPMQSAADRHAFRHSLEANMPEAMAMVKLKGFIYDLGGEVMESVPGLIKVRLTDPAEQKPTGGLFGWGARKTSVLPVVATATDLELHMERLDPAQTSKLTITLVMRPRGGLATADWRTRCTQISRDLQAYLMGR